MRYTDRKGNTLNLNECISSDRFFIEADVYIREPLEMRLGI